jgi:hypothetical protein
VLPVVLVPPLGYNTLLPLLSMEGETTITKQLLIVDVSLFVFASFTVLAFIIYSVIHSQALIVQDGPLACLFGVS